MINIEPDGAIALTSGDFELNFVDDAPDHIEVVNRASDNEEYWDFWSFEISQLREFLQLIDEREKEMNMPKNYHFDCYRKMSPAPAQWGQFAQCNLVCDSCGKHVTAGVTVFVDGVVTPAPGELTWRELAAKIASFPDEVLDSPALIDSEETMHRIESVAPYDSDEPISLTNPPSIDIWYN